MKNEAPSLLGLGLVMAGQNLRNSTLFSGNTRQQNKTGWHFRKCLNTEVQKDLSEKAAYVLLAELGEDASY